MSDKGIIYMNINVLSKYIILFLFTVLLVLSIFLAIQSAENKALQKANAVLKEQIALRDTAINEIDKNIKSLQQQVARSEQICNERLKARNDVLLLLKNKDSPARIQPAASLNKEQAKNGAVSAPFNTRGIMDYEKSNIVIDSINSYWVQFIKSGKGAGSPSTFP